MAKIGEKVRDVRLKSGLNQREFGKMLTVSQSYISCIENSKEIPTPMFLKLFCLLYSVDETSLMD